MPPALAGPPPSRSAFSAVPVRLRGGGNEGRMADEGGDQGVPHTDAAKKTVEKAASPNLEVMLRVANS